MTLQQLQSMFTEALANLRIASDDFDNNEVSCWRYTVCEFAYEITGSISKNELHSVGLEIAKSNCTDAEKARLRDLYQVTLDYINARDALDAA